MDQIKNIIFDFGGVVYNIRYENMADELARRGVSQAEKFYGKSHQTHEMDQFEVGLMPVPEFRDYIRRMSGKPFTDKEVDDILNSMLLGLPKERYHLLQQVHQHYRTFLFSNTNAIHYDHFTQEMEQQYHTDITKQCFDACYYSHIMHKRKPSVEGFLEILTEQQLNPAETLFIDDSPQNLQGAIEAGIHAYHLRGELSSLFDASNHLKPIW